MTRGKPVKTTANWAKMVGMIALLGGLGGCQPNLQTHGKVIDPDALGLLRVGLSRSDIVDLLGSPSSKDPFDARIWYYISRQNRSIAFYDPSTLDQKIIKIKFDATEHVTAIDHQNGIEKIADITATDHAIPSQGHSLGVLTQIFGNIGRFADKTGPR